MLSAVFLRKTVMTTCSSIPACWQTGPISFANSNARTKGSRPNNCPRNPQGRYRLLLIERARAPAEYGGLGTAQDFGTTVHGERKCNAPASPKDLDPTARHIQNLSVLVHVEEKFDLVSTGALESIRHNNRRSLR